MSDASIFRFAAQPSAPEALSAPGFQQTALDPDASARLSTIDRAFDDLESSGCAPEVELVQHHLAAPLGDQALSSELTEIFAAATAPSDISLIETTVADTDLSAAIEVSAPAPLEVAPILDAAGELQPGADAYTPPAPFEIHVPASLAVAETAPVAATAEALSPAVPEARELTEVFDLASLSAPIEPEHLIEHAIAQEEAVAEMSAVAAEFVAEQIASDACAGAPAASASAPVTADQPAVPATSALADAAHALNAEPSSDRRRKRRALISSPIRVRGIDLTTAGPDEITTTVDVSRYGILFHTILDTYQRGMDVAVVFPYHKSATGAHVEQFGRVVRLQDLPDGRHAVAIALGVGVGEHLVDANGRQLANETVQVSNSTAPQVKKPLVLLADSDGMLRDTMKIFLQNEGYEVIAVSNAADAREVINMFMPAMIVAEIEAEEGVMHGLDLCAHVKSSPSLKHIPVVLTSRSAYPSDYSNAHSLGAVVCMAKPYKQERLAHIVRLLAPLPEHLQLTGAPRIPDPTRGFRSDCNVSQRGSNPSRNGAKKTNSHGPAKSRFKFPSFR
jgi:CheY-like chemotaxis protein